MKEKKYLATTDNEKNKIKKKKKKEHIQQDGEQQ